MKKSELTIGDARLLDVVEDIIKSPDSFNMDTWLKQTDCGTVACLAGHGAIKSGRFFDYKDVCLVGTLAQKFFCLSIDEAGNLFYLSNWPLYYQKMYLKANTGEGRAKALRLRVNYFFKNRI